MTDKQTMTRKEFPNGDVALDEGDGLVYHTADAAYSVELDLPRPLSDEPYGVDLVRTTNDAEGLERQQRLTLAEYRSQMAAEEHVHEVEQTLLDQGRDGLEAEMSLVAAMPYETDEPLYLVGLYPPVQAADAATLNVLRIDGERLDIAPVARGPVAEMAAIEQRLFDVQAEGDTDVSSKQPRLKRCAHIRWPPTPPCLPTKVLRWPQTGPRCWSTTSYRHGKTIPTGRMPVPGTSHPHPSLLPWCCR